MLPNGIKCILNCYSLCGFLPGGTAISFLRRFIIFLLHISLCIWCTYCTIENLNSRRYLIKFIDVLNYSVYCGACTILYWLILYDSYASRLDKSELWQTFPQLNNQYGIALRMRKLEYFFEILLLLVGDNLFAFGLLHVNPMMLAV